MSDSELREMIGRVDMDSSASIELPELLLLLSWKVLFHANSIFDTII